MKNKHETKCAMISLTRFQSNTFLTFKIDSGELGNVICVTIVDSRLNFFSMTKKYLYNQQRI